MNDDVQDENEENCDLKVEDLREVQRQQAAPESQKGGHPMPHDDSHFQVFIVPKSRKRDRIDVLLEVRADSGSCAQQPMGSHL